MATGISFPPSGLESEEGPGAWGVYRLSSESPVFQGGEVESGCSVLYSLCKNDIQVLRLEHQVCRVPKGRPGPDRL
jgi:hypothetical protein